MRQAETPEVDTSIKLGQSTCLLSGYKADVYDIHFQPSPKPALQEVPIVIEDPNLDVKWSYPIITLHKNREDLISELYQIKLRRISFEDKPSEGGAVARWPSGPLTLRGLNDETLTQAVQNLSDQVGVDLSTDWSYALVRRTRTVGSVTHKSFTRGVFRNPDPENTLMSEAFASIKKLAKKEKKLDALDLDGARSYLEYIETYGSHYVSSVNVGDSLFQVFAYNQTEFEKIVEVYDDPINQLEGPGSTAFVIFTTPKNELGYGFAAAVGTIGITSCDPALEKTLNSGQWHDEAYTQTNSIFSPYIRPDSVNANEVFKNITVISTELTSLEVYAEYYRKLMWRRVFKGAMYAKYAGGSGVAPYFSNNCPFKLTEVFRDSNESLDGDGLLSTLATPTVSMCQELVKYNDIKLQFPEMVKRFSIFANSIQITHDSEETHATYEVPGKNTVTLLAYIISVGGNEPCAVPPNLKLSDAAFKDFKSERLSCGEFFGGLRVCNTGESVAVDPRTDSKSGTGGSGCGESFVVMNGLIFEYKEGKVCVVKDVRDAPSSGLLEGYITDIQLGLTAAEARLNHVLQSGEKGNDGLSVIQGFLLWLVCILDHVDHQSKELLALQARAKYLAKVTANPNNSGVPIPYLKYEAYGDVVDRVQQVLETSYHELNNYQNQIRARKAEERQIDILDEINQNIINSGKLLEAYIRTQAKYQKDMQQLFSEVIDQKKIELDEALKEMEELTTKLTDQRSVVEKSIEAYKTAVHDWYQKEMIRAGLEIAAKLFMIGYTFTIPVESIDALKDLGNTVDKIQKFALILDAVVLAYKAFETLPDDPQSVIEALDAADGEQMPTALEWDEMKLQFDATLATGPPVSAKHQLTADFSILVLRGKALLQCQDKVQQTCTALAAEHQKLELSKAHEKRLDDLTLQLSAKPEELDVDNIDLIGLSGNLVFFQRQMLMTLSSTIVLQDRALQYEYLRPPTPIGSFTLLNLQLTMLKQSQSINMGLNVQPKPDSVGFPIIYEVHGVPAESITNGNLFTFDIDLNRREFLSYNYVRVEKVEAEIGGIESTKSGQYYTELYFDGEPFYDRGFNREGLVFQTSPRFYTSLHDVDPNSYEYQYRQVELRDFDDKVSQITPFSRWNIGLPESPTNEGITFVDDPRGVTVRLVFHIYAQLKETSLIHANDAETWIKSRQLLLRDPRKIRHKSQKIQSEPTTVQDKSTKTTSTTVTDVLALMSGKSVCNGWDSVFTMTAEQVNEQLRLQYEDRQGNPNFVREINEVNRRKTSEEIIEIQRLNFCLDAPKMQFRLNNRDYCCVFMYIMSGTYKKSIEVNGEEILIDSVEIQEPDDSYIKGDVALATMQGSVSSKQDVAINLRGGSFSPHNFNASVDSSAIRYALTDYFLNLEDGYELYKLGTLDLTGYTGLQSLIPTSFKFNVLHTLSDRDLLQLFIATTGEPNDTLHLYMAVEEPIPAEFESSLIVNTKIFFSEVLPFGIGDGGMGLVLSSTEPPQNEHQDKAWSSKSTAGKVDVPFGEKRLTHEKRLLDTGNGIVTIESESWIKMAEKKIPVILKDMHFQHGQSTQNGLLMTYTSNDIYMFQYGRRTRQSSFYGMPDWGKVQYEPHDLQVQIKMEGMMPLIIVGEGQDQFVELKFLESYADCQADIEPPGGLCEASNHDLENTFLEEFKNHVPQALTKAFHQQKFNPISLFALKNILFPAKNLIDMKEAYVPGDMVVFGKFTEE